MIRKGDVVRGISLPDRKVEFDENGIPTWSYEEGHEFKGVVKFVSRKWWDQYWCITTDGEEVSARFVELIADEEEAEAIRHRVFVEIPSDRGLEKAKREEAKEKIRKAKRRVVKLKAVMTKQKIFKEEA